MRQLALPAESVGALALEYGRSQVPNQIVTGALITMAFFFLLRVGEYTPSRSPRLTIPLRKADVKLWKSTQPISPDAPWEILQTADGVTITLENQKNGHKGCVLHHEATGDPFMCPVRAVCVLLHAIQNKAGSTALGSFHDRAGQPQRITATDIRTGVRRAALRTGLAQQGYDLARIGSHSLRSGGAVALKLAGYDSDMIKKLGRWSSNTYLLYIQSQIAQLTAGVAKAMHTRLQYHNVG